MPSEGRRADRSLPPGYGGEAGLERRLQRLLAGGGALETIGVSSEGRPIRVYRRRAEPLPEAQPRAPAPDSRRTESDPDAATSDPRSSGEGKGLGRSSSKPIEGTIAEPERVLVLSLLHPMEWIALEAHLALLESWFSPEGSRGSEPLPEGTQIASLPVAHPDGFARAETALRSGVADWVRTGRSGVDLNRNFPVGHRPRPHRFAWWPLYRPGVGPLTEAESRSIASFARAYRPTVALSLHSFGRWIFVPPARRRLPLPATCALLAQARRASAGSRYRAAPLGRWSPFFRAGGTELDFLHEEIGARAFLVEVSRGGIARWGARRLWDPFTFFNPPDPEREISLVLPVLRRLVQRPAPGAMSPAPPSGWNSKT